VRKLLANCSAGSAMDVTFSVVYPVTGGNAGHVMPIANNLNAPRSQVFIASPITA
jgi:hypothetical protein